MERTDSFMRAYTVKEVSRMIDVPPGTIRQWEKSLVGVLEIPRDEHGARYYTEFEIDILQKIKMLREKGLQFDVIKDILNNSEPTQIAVTSTIPVMTQSEAIQRIKSLTEAIQQLSTNLDMVQEAVRKEILNLTEQLHQQKQYLEQQQKYIEQSLEERDRKLMTFLREQQEKRHQETAQQQKKKWFRWFKS